MLYIARFLLRVPRQRQLQHRLRHQLRRLCGPSAFQFPCHVLLPTLRRACMRYRLRVWDNLYGANGPPDREIVHSHDFNR